MNSVPNKKLRILNWSDFPEGFVPFPLDPTGLKFETKELSPGVYALLSNKKNVDNCGFVVGGKGVLAIDAHISVGAARQIQKAIREVTDKPILYLVNSNYHGDHTFGNCAFPAETKIVQHRYTAELINYFDEEKAFMLPCLNNDPKILEGVELRRPDLIFDDYLRLDLGGRAVEVYYFGPANTPGDTITYVPEAKAAWTGNVTAGNLIITLHSDAATYMNTLARFVQTLELETLVSAHCPPGPPSVIGRYLNYLSDLSNSIRRAVSAGWRLEEAMERIPLQESLVADADEPHPRFYSDFHRLNVRKTYLSLTESLSDS